MPILIAFDPSALYRAGLISLLGKTCFKTVREAASIEELSRVLDDAGDTVIVLIAASHGPPDAVTAIQEIMSLAPAAKIILLGTTLEIDLLAKCYAEGVSGYLLENISPTALEESLKLVCIGEKVFSSEMAQLIGHLAASRQEDKWPNFSEFHLSLRDQEILSCLAEGKSNKEIARNLNIAESTVKLYLKRILRNIHVSNRTQAALWVAQRRFEARVAKPEGAKHERAALQISSAMPGNGSFWVKKEIN